MLAGFSSLHVYVSVLSGCSLSVLALSSERPLFLNIVSVQIGLELGAWLELGLSIGSDLGILDEALVVEAISKWEAKSAEGWAARRGKGVPLHAGEKKN